MENNSGLQDVNTRAGGSVNEGNISTGTAGDAAGETEMLRQLAALLLSERKEEELSERNAKLKRVLLLLAGGAALATVMVMPGMVRIFKDFFKDRSSWDEWRLFNEHYLRNTIRRLEKNKVVEVADRGGYGEVILTEGGRRKVLKFALESLRISKPDRWDGKWRMVFYDVADLQKGTRERLRGYLRAAGFYPLQKSVYLHAYPCEREIEFLKYYLGISSGVRVVIADKIENDAEFRAYFGVS